MLPIATQQIPPWPFDKEAGLEAVIRGCEGGALRRDGVVPVHEHTGYEHIIVLAGTQRDQNGTATAGRLIINPPGTRHNVVSEAGCIVLAIYEKPVKFLQD